MADENRKTTLGVFVYAEPSRLKRTLESIRTYTAEPFRLVLLADGLDAATSETLNRLSDIPQLATDQSHGAPACFNGLIAYDDPDTAIFL